MHGLRVQVGHLEQKQQCAIGLGRAEDPIDAPTVFGYISPDYKAPVSLTNVPEQALLNLSAFNKLELFDLELLRRAISNAGCDITLFLTAAQNSNADSIQLFSERFFRGRMPTALSNGVNTLLSNDLASETAFNKVFYLLGLLISFLSLWSGVMDRRTFVNRLLVAGGLGGASALTFNSPCCNERYTLQATRP
jgi:hypothetical protein